MLGEKRILHVRFLVAHPFALCKMVTSVHLTLVNMVGHAKTELVNTRVSAILVMRPFDLTSLEQI
ncbi:unnamed protein product [Ranitomeya imitator]|uniref:Uncharacterized protein n=1 Tax=Ranitomeya imitator TaxID=111125 RepID=A0ABN9LWE5_9NEOB|nr:unnamed protein product [Ranitomeya imitator]